MTDKQKITLNLNVEANCGKCIHNEVCSKKKQYRDGVARMIQELQPFVELIECRLECTYFMRM